MNPSQPSPSANGACWALVAVKGRELGRGYALEPGETILGSAPPRDRGLDLASQEDAGPRSLAARHAVIEAREGVLTVRDLESPGGTFVNRQRLLTGQSRTLQDGDTIQLGGIKLRVEQRAGATGSSAPAPQPAAPARSSLAQPPATPFLTAKGARCASWDDFLVLAARDWRNLCDELDSGRLAGYLHRIGRLDLAPTMAGDHTVDEKLDLWLARLPARISAAPELDVHPGKLVVSAAGGGMTTQSLKIANVGYRLLRWTARVEPAACGWLSIKGDTAGRPFTTIDHTVLEIAFQIPDLLPAPLEASIVIESNGGTRRVAARIERASVAAEPAAPADFASAWGAGAVQRFERLPLARRVVLGAAVAIGGRTVPLLIAWSPLGALSPDGQGLLSVASAFAGLGAGAGAIAGRARGTIKDALALGFTAGAAGLIVSAVLVAMVHTFDAPALLAIPVWGALGAAAGLLSALFAPVRRHDAEGSS